MNYCSHCGSDQLSFKIPEGDNRPRHICGQCDRIHYLNPRMVVGCVPVFEDRILLCRRAIEPRHGYWNLPAGYLEMGETAEAGARRETLEEAGAEVEVIRLHAVYDIPHISQVYLFFLAGLPSPELAPGAESLEAQLFRPEEIPYDDMAFPSSTYAIKTYLADKKDGFKGVHLGGYVMPKAGLGG